MWLHFVFPTTKQNLSSLFCLANSHHHFLTVRHLCSLSVVLGPQPFQFPLCLMAVIRAIIILLVQDQPDLKTWIRSCDPDAVGFAKIDCFFVPLMFVPIEYGPNLVPFFKQIPAPSATSRQSFRSRKLQCFLSYCDRDPHTTTTLDRNQSTCTNFLYGRKIRRLCISPFTK